MATRSEKLDWQYDRKMRKRGSNPYGFNSKGGLTILSRKQILAESEKLVIKPGMKLTWDNELNRMVWK